MRPTRTSSRFFLHRCLSNDNSTKLFLVFSSFSIFLDKLFIIFNFLNHLDESFIILNALNLFHELFVIFNILQRTFFPTNYILSTSVRILRFYSPLSKENSTNYQTFLMFSILRSLSISSKENSHVVKRKFDELLDTFTDRINTLQIVTSYCFRTEAWFWSTSMPSAVCIVVACRTDRIRFPWWNCFALCPLLLRWLVAWRSFDWSSWTRSPHLKKKIFSVIVFHRNTNIKYFS